MKVKLTDRASIPAVVADLTLDEKMALAGAHTACHTTAIPDRDIPSISLTDGATGVQVMLDYATATERTKEEQIAAGR